MHRKPLFRGLGPENMQILSMLLKPIMFHPNHGHDYSGVLFHEGDTCRSMYIVYSGSCCAILSQDAGDESKALCRFIHGDFFGDIALVFDLPRSTNMQCASSGQTAILTIHISLTSH